ncbi:hypothetical protein [Fluviicola sp.]|uniref:hypothetical protein n=1 Tax=Fluviicola sp. TaxID=1917219 RepID=UPI003D2E6D5A
MYKPLLEKYKSKEQIDQAIKKLTLLQTREYSIIKDFYFKLFPIYPIPTVPVETTLLQESLSVYRSRPFTKDIDYNFKKSFSYPDVSDYTTIQRANWEGRNVFYASDTLYTSISETKKMYNEKEFYVSKWGFNFRNSNIQKVNIVPLAFGQLSMKNPWKSILNSELNLKNHLKKNDYSDTEIDLIFHFFVKIGELFTLDNEETYPISAFLADQILFHQHSIKSDLLPILIYPSVTNNFDSCNFAISPFFVDKYMTLEKVFKIKIDDVSPEKVKLSFHNLAIEKSDHELNWYTMDYEKDKGYYQFKSISCSCGYNLKLLDIENIKFIKDSQSFHHSEIMASITEKIDLFSDLKQNPIIEEKGIVGGLWQNTTLKQTTLKLRLTK